jgi:hypothetical protein
MGNPLESLREARVGGSDRGAAVAVFGNEGAVPVIWVRTASHRYRRTNPRGSNQRD